MNLWSKVKELETSPWGKIVTVGLIAGEKILTGKRRDNGLWTSPGGHMDDGEDVLSAAVREVKEETGLSVNAMDLKLIQADRLVSHRSGKPFVVFAFLAHMDQEEATNAQDPDDEVSEWKWVKIDNATPELQMSARHAKDDFVLKHLGIKGSVNMAAETEAPADKGRTMKEVSKDTQNAGFDESPTAPEPKKLTPQEMKQNPEDLLDPDDSDMEPGKTPAEF